MPTLLLRIKIQTLTQIPHPVLRILPCKDARGPKPLTPDCCLEKNATDGKRKPLQPHKPDANIPTKNSQLAIPASLPLASLTPRKKPTSNNTG